MVNFCEITTILIVSRTFFKYWYLERQTLELNPLEDYLVQSKILNCKGKDKMKLIALLISISDISKLFINVQIYHINGL